MANEAQMPMSTVRCDGCATEQGPFMKLSMGRDFFGRAYDRLSPSADQFPKWYCELCSMYKTLQRDYRDIRSEVDKITNGQSSELRHDEQLQRARLRLQEIAALLSARGSASHFIDPREVNNLLQRMQEPRLPSAIA